MLHTAGTLHRPDTSRTFPLSQVLLSETAVLSVLYAAPQFMVIAGYTVFVPGNSSAINAIRALRALRPLRTITRFESLRGVIVCFLEVTLESLHQNSLLFTLRMTRTWMAWRCGRNPALAVTGVLCCRCFPARALSHSYRGGMALWTEPGAD